MKKSLIALAVLAASGASFAQSSVSVYGIADIWFGSTKATAADGSSLRQTVLESGGVNGSRFGFKGTEDLGGGLKANFNLEQGFSIDSGAQATTGVAFSRQAWVGVSGNFGAVKLGRSGTAYDDVMGTNNNTFDSALTAKPWVGYAATVNNQIHFATANYSGFSGAVSYALGEDKAATTSAGKILSLHAKYENGPLMVGYAHQAETSGAGVVATGAGSGIATAGVSIDPVTKLPVFGAAGDKVQYNMITGSYDLGVAKLMGSINTTKATESLTADVFKANEFQIGANVPLAKSLTLGVGYGQSKAKFNGENFAKSTAYSAALVYSLSKRTFVYTGFNNGKITDTVADTSTKSSIYALGLNHSF